MKTGILADIHEHANQLRQCLDLFEVEQVDRVELLGDVAETGKYLDEIVEQLTPYSVLGVFGNHDLGLCDDPVGEVKERYSPAVLEFFNGLSASLSIDGCLYTHGAPWWDALDPVEYYVGENPYSDSVVQRAGEFQEKVIFMGHFHRWRLAVDGELHAWSGESPVDLMEEKRYLITIDAVMAGCCAIFDSEDRILWPHRL